MIVRLDFIPGHGIIHLQGKKMISLADRLSLFPISTKVNPFGELEIAGCKLTSLTKEHNTPLYVYDAATIKNQVSILKQLLKKHYGDNASIAYATKAYFSLSFARKLNQLGIGADLITIGDIRTAQKAALDPGLLHLHGNNKSEEEIRAALEGIGAIVIDSLDELTFVESIAKDMQKKARIWLRITPDITVDTHRHIQTSHAASKFGLHISDGQAALAVQQASVSKWINLVGLHTHLGSQLRETNVYEEAIRKMYALAAKNGFIPQEFSTGGGWGVRYTEDDQPNEPGLWIEAVSNCIQQECKGRGWPLPQLVIEPGRFTVARAGVALYSVGSQKQTPDGQHIVAVDGGIADNPRVALYGASYTAMVADRANAVNEIQSRVVGKFCESGDVLIEELLLPKIYRGETLAIPVAGAYQLSMSSNYNFATRPTVLWLEDGNVEVMQNREHPEDIGWWSLNN
jgi:diaminopimelate decarboxylase